MRASILLLLCSSILADAASAQVVVRPAAVLARFPARSTHRIDPAPVTCLGDVDGDGLADFALGQAPGAGVEVRRGADGMVIYAIEDPGANALYATALARLDDLDGDGVAELAVGSSHRLVQGSAGFVEIRSGVDGALLRTLPGPTDVSFGRALVGVDDLDGDGLGDLVVATPETFSATVLETSVEAISSADGGVLWRATRPALFSFGAALTRLGDLDGDGIGEVAATTQVVGALDTVILSGASGATVRVLADSTAFSHPQLVGLGDLDGDGLDELAVTDVTEEQSSGRAGIVRVFRGSDGSLLRVHRPRGPHGAFGVALDAGDVDGDGLLDLLVGQSDLELTSQFLSDRGAVLAFSGAGGHLLFERLGDVPTGEFGNDVAYLGDADGDGTCDLVGTGLFGPGGSLAFGRVVSCRASTGYARSLRR